MISFQKPSVDDIPVIKKIMTQWTEPEEVEKYCERIINEINGKTEFNMRFWVIKEDTCVIGITGLSDPLPVTKPFITTPNPQEIKILYLDQSARGKGNGKTTIAFLEQTGKQEGITELLVRSAERYKDTAWEFYVKMGYKEVGEIYHEKAPIMKVFRKLL